MRTPEDFRRVTEVLFENGAFTKEVDGTDAFATINPKLTELISESVPKCIELRPDEPFESIMNGSIMMGYMKFIGLEGVTMPEIGDVVDVISSFFGSIEKRQMDEWRMLLRIRRE